MALKRVVTTDRTLQAIQDNVDQALSLIQATPFQGGTLLTSVALQTGSTQIAHTLSRQPRGWVIVDINAAVTVYRTAWDAKFLTLQSSAGATASIWVF